VCAIRLTPCFVCVQVSNPFSSAGQQPEGGDASTTVSEGRRALRQLVSAGLLRPIGIPLRLDDAGRVVTECCAMGKIYELRRRRGGDGGSHGRGGAAQWASQWWAAANDAAEVSGVKPVKRSHPSNHHPITQLPPTY
jgi:hypothetical protein